MLPEIAKEWVDKAEEDYGFACAGMEYTMEWAEDQKPFDEVVEDKGVKVLIDAKAMMFLLGTEMDFQSTTLKSGFVFNNPNQVSACGCGESVQLKPAEG